MNGHVKVNDHVVNVLGTKVDPEIDEITVDESPVLLDQKKVYIALNKPRAYITSCNRAFPNEKIVIDLVDIPERVYPIGRLDKDSTGLLLLTNDGRLHHRLSHPSFDHEKEYDVQVAEAISPDTLKKISRGVAINGQKTRPAAIRKVNSRQFRITLKEGRNRQIRRMVNKVGSRVTQLKRIRISNIHIGNLPEGKWRYLSDAEQKDLLASTLTMA